MGNIHHDNKRFNFSQITPYLYIGTHFCCEGHLRDSLLHRHVRADINLEMTHIDTPIGADYYLWLPIKDKTAPSFNALYVGAHFIKNLVERKIHVYVHCKSGHGRSPTLVAAYLILNGMKPKEAWSFIRKKREIHPTKSQLKAIQHFFEEYIKMHLND
ncbi:dual specificity protein phosphatase family protein [Candidatus Woesearchaeota archaeon]|nr:dual specificity protein phosphatase family protein [Candidatus Woesearchaeota archaeon]